MAFRHGTERVLINRTSSPLEVISASRADTCCEVRKAAVFSDCNRWTMQYELAPLMRATPSEARVGHRSRARLRTTGRVAGDQRRYHTWCAVPLVHACDFTQEISYAELPTV